MEDIYQYGHYKIRNQEHSQKVLKRKGEKGMPKVGKKSYPYTKAGIKAANKAKKRQKKKQSKSKKKVYR